MYRKAVQGIVKQWKVNSRQFINIYKQQLYNICYPHSRWVTINDNFLFLKALWRQLIDWLIDWLIN